MACCIFLACVIGLIISIKIRVFKNKKYQRIKVVEWRLHPSQHQQKQG